MKKPVLSLFFILYLTTVSFAAPCYGPRLPEKNKIAMGLQNYTVMKRYLKDNYGKLKSMQEFLLLSYGVFDWLSIDLKGGIGNIKQHPVDASQLTYASYLSGGYGFRVKFYDNNKIKGVFGFQHISVHPHTVYVGTVKNKAVLDDWQFSALASYDFKMATPYLGAKWSRMDYIHWTDGERKREKSDLTKSVGLVCGLDIPFGEKFWLNLEGQFIDVEAFSVSANYKF